MSKGELGIGTSQLLETEDEIIASYYMPGFDEKNIKVKLKDNILTISGEMKAINQFETQQSQQYVSGSFQQSVSLPANAVTDDIKKEFKDGVFKILIPKQKD